LTVDDAIVFQNVGSTGFNTWYSGFIAAAEIKKRV